MGKTTHPEPHKQQNQIHSLIWVHNPYHIIQILMSVGQTNLKILLVVNGKGLGLR